MRYPCTTPPSRPIGLAGLALLLSIAGCSDPDLIVDPPTGPVARSELVGDFVATELVATTDEDVIDVLDTGGELRITLESNALTSGRFFAPGGAEDGGDLDADMDGAWTYNPIGRTVRFEQSADTFVRDMVFDVVRAGLTVELRGVETFPPTTIRAVLERR